MAVTFDDLPDAAHGIKFDDLPDAAHGIRFDDLPNAGSFGKPLSDEDLATASQPLRLSEGGAPAGDLTKFIQPATGGALSPSVVTAEDQPVTMQEFTQERIPIMKATYQAPLISLPKPENTGVVSGIVRGVEGLAEGLTSPLNLALLPVMGGASSAVQKVATGTFAAQMAHDLPGKVQEITEAKTPGEAAEKITEALGQTAMIGLGAKHALAREGAGIRPPSIPEDEINRAAAQNQLQTIASGTTAAGDRVPPVIYQRDAPYQTVMDTTGIDGLTATKNSLRAAMQGPMSPEKTAIFNEHLDEVDNQLLNFHPDDVSASAERVAAQGQSPPPKAGVEPPTATGGPSEDVGTSSLFKQAQEDAGAVAPALPAGSPGLVDQVKAAYGRVKDRTGYPGVAISDVIKESGLPADAVRAYLEDARDRGETVLSQGDWSLASDEQRAAHIPKFGRKFLDVRFPEFDQAHPLNAKEAPTPASAPSETSLDPALVKTYQDSAERIADQVTKGQPTSVREAARDAALDNAMSSMKGGKNPNVGFMRKSAQEAASKAAAKRGTSLDAENEQGTTLGDQQASSEATPVQSAAKADTVKAVQDTVAQLPENLRNTAQAFLENPDASLRDLAEKLGISHQTVANHLKAMQEHFQALRDEGLSLGPGAASIAERLGREGLNSIKNEMVDAKRAELGLPERTPAVRRTFGAIWDQAMHALDENPKAGQQLVDSLKTKARPLTDLEDAILTHEQMDRQQSYDEAVDNVNKSENDAERVAAENDLAKARDALHDVFEVGSKAGTENARGLNARRLLIKDDFTLAKMEHDKIASKGGKKAFDALPKKEQDSILADVKKSHDRITELEKQIETSENIRRDELAKHYFDQLIKETKKDVKESVKQGKSFTDFTESQAQKARDRIAARRREGRLNSLPVNELVDHAIIGADYIAKGAKTFAEFSKKMIADFGEAVKPFLKDIFDKSKEFHDSNEKFFKEGAKTKEKTNAKPAEVLAKAKAEAGSGKALSHKTVYDLARAHINAGADGFEKVMKAVHADLEPFHKGLTEREVRDAFSEYGKVKFPSKEADKVKLAEYRRIGQLQSAIDDAISGSAPKKSGMQRSKPTLDVRKKMTELRDAMAKAGIETNSAEERLASRNEARATVLKNQIEALDEQLKTGEKPTKTASVPESPQVEQLRAERDAMKAELERIEEDQNPQKTEAQKQVDKLTKVRDRLSDTLSGTRPENAPKDWNPLSAAADDIKAEIAAMNELKAQIKRDAKPIGDPGYAAEQSKIKALEKSINDYEEKTKSSDFSAKGKPYGPDSKQIADLKIIRDERRNTYNKLKDAQKIGKSASDIAADEAQKGVDSAAAALDKWDRILKGEMDAPKGTVRQPKSALEEDLLSEVESMKTAAAEIRREAARDPNKENSAKEKYQLAALDKSIAEYERKLRDADFSTKGKTHGPDTVAIAKAKSLRNAAKKAFDDLRSAQKPKRSPDEIRLDNYKKSLQRQIDDLQTRQAAGNYAPRPKSQLTLDQAAIDLRTARDAERQKFQEGLIKDRLANRTTATKMADAAVQWSRVVKLASAKVYPKLLEAAVSRAIFEPASRLLGQPLRLINRDVYNKAYPESGASVKSAAKYIATGLTSWGKAWEKLRTGKTNIDVASGVYKLDQEMINFVGNSHGMVKEPLRQASFEANQQLRFEQAIRDGLDPNDPIVQTSIRSAAAESANRQLFTGDNPFTRFIIKLPINALKRSNTPGLPMLGRTLEFLMPIVNVPTNIAIHTARLNPLIGFSEFALRMAHASRNGELANGAAKLSQADAELLSRVFKTAALGTVLSAYAWTHPENFGGLFEEKDRKRGQLKPDEVKIFGVTIPGWMNHVGEMQHLNTVASSRRVWDRYVRQEGAPNAAMEALAFSMMAPVRRLPFIEPYLRIFSEYKTPGQTLGAMSRDAVVPGVVTQAAGLTDPNQRSPKTFTDEWKLPIPKVRETVPARR